MALVGSLTRSGASSPLGEKVPTLRAVFLGNDAWSVPPLEALAGSSHDLVRVITRTPRPAGRGNALRSTAVAEAAREMNLPLSEIDSIGDAEAVGSMAAEEPDVLVVVAYGEILPRSVLELPRLAPVNVHFSLLPKLRGANPVRAALLTGLPETGVTTMRMDEGLDTGDVLLQRSEAILEDDDAGTLGSRLANLGGSLLVRTLDAMAADDLRPVAQDEDAATYAPKLRREDRTLRWTEDARTLARTVRALAPEPAANTSFRGRSLKVYRAVPKDGAGEPGTIVDLDQEGLTVATGAGMLRLLDVGPQGRRRMSAAQFARGARPRAGERME
ncbi:MAG: methionyl-tRNA formyltransferase [Actinomycetota bacterium]|nr:methionyl-tRNA formyltransferase [Actinomycetota bacterium]